MEGQDLLYRWRDVLGVFVSKYRGCLVEFEMRSANDQSQDDY